jgi:sec-independent protein translocase protein TatA
MHSSGLLFFSNLFSTDMLVIAFFALLLFGGEKLPEIARGLGKGIRDFKDASEGVKREINNQINSFEEKRADEALNKRAEEIQNNIGPSAGQQSLVENTMPVNESNLTENEITSGEHLDAHTEPVNEAHVDARHTDAETTENEQIKNS